MRKEKKWHIIDDDMRIDMRFEVESGDIKHFAINVALLMNDRAEDVFRVDTAHKGLHIMKFWLSPEPKYLETKRKDMYNAEFSEWKKEVMDNCRRWIEMYKKKKDSTD